MALSGAQPGAARGGGGVGPGGEQGPGGPRGSGYAQAHTPREPALSGSFSGSTSGSLHRVASVEERERDNRERGGRDRDRGGGGEQHHEGGGEGAEQRGAPPKAVGEAPSGKHHPAGRDVGRWWSSRRSKPQ